jgi:hypothetical protein
MVELMVKTILWIFEELLEVARVTAFAGSGRQANSSSMKQFLYSYHQAFYCCSERQLHRSLQPPLWLDHKLAGS